MIKHKFCTATRCWNKNTVASFQFYLNLKNWSKSIFKDNRFNCVLGSIECVLFVDSKSLEQPSYHKSTVKHSKLCCVVSKPMMRNNLFRPGLVLLQDNTHSHTISHTIKTIKNFDWRLLIINLSPDLAPSDPSLPTAQELVCVSVISGN